MTDLSQVTAYTTELTTPLNKAQETMIKRGVRMLLVRDADGHIVGLMTSRDIEGENRPASWPRPAALGKICWSPIS
jgi:predicted transcriptional regulator